MMRLIHAGSGSYNVINPNDVVVKKVRGKEKANELLVNVNAAIKAIAITQHEDTKTPGQSVVLKSYQDEYRLRGNARHCSDWLATELEGLFEDPETGLFDVFKFASFLKANGVDLSGKWYNLSVTQKAGWQGRFRMNGRQKLEQKITERGTIVFPDINGETITEKADYTWLLAKQEHFSKIKGLGVNWDAKDGEVVIIEK